jgi:DNA-binding beta-propeller fold protein YncE
VVHSSPPSVSVVEPRSNAVVGSIPLPGCTQARTGAASPSGDRFLAVCNNRAFVIDTSTSFVRDTVSFAEDSVLSSTFDPSGQYAYISAHNGVIVLDLFASPPQVRTVLTGPDYTFVGGLSISPDGKRAYLANTSLKAISIIDLTYNPPRLVARVPHADATIASFQNILVSPDGRRVYVLISTFDSFKDAGVTVIDAASLAATTMSLGASGSFTMVLSPDGANLYIGDIRWPMVGAEAPPCVVLAGSNEVCTPGAGIAVVDTSTMTVVARYHTAVNFGHSMAIDGDNGSLYIAAWNSGLLHAFSIAGSMLAELARIPVGALPAQVVIPSTRDVRWSFRTFGANLTWDGVARYTTRVRRMEPVFATHRF